MSQYEDYFFSQEERDNQSFMLNSPCYNQSRIQQIRYLPDEYFYKQAPPTQEVPETTETYQKPQNITFKTDLIKDQGKLRKTRVIETDQHKLHQRKYIFKGLKNDTTQLTINFKTILVSYLKELVLSKELSGNDKQLIQEFIKEIPSFPSIKKLIKSNNIQQRCIRFIKSLKIIEKIQRSQSQIINKITLIKYMKSCELNFTNQKIIKWKDSD